MICAKILGDLFFFDQRTHFLSIFERKRGVPGKGKTENLGDFDGFQLSGMPTFQILRFAEIEINPCNPRSNTGTKKPVGLTGVDLFCSVIFCSLNHIKTFLPIHIPFFEFWLLFHMYMFHLQHNLLHAISHHQRICDWI